MDHSQSESSSSTNHHQHNNNNDSNNSNTFDPGWKTQESTLSDDQQQSRNGAVVARQDSTDLLGGVHVVVSLANRKNEIVPVLDPSNSLLSSSDDDDDDDDSRNISQQQQQQQRTSQQHHQYMEDASMETIRKDDGKQKMIRIEAAGPLGRRWTTTTTDTTHRYNNNCPPSEHCILVPEHPVHHHHHHHRGRRHPPRRRRQYPISASSTAAATAEDEDTTTTTNNNNAGTTDDDNEEEVVVVEDDSHSYGLLEPTTTGGSIDDISIMTGSTTTLLLMQQSEHDIFRPVRMNHSPPSLPPTAASLSDYSTTTATDANGVVPPTESSLLLSSSSSSSPVKSVVPPITDTTTTTPRRHNKSLLVPSSPSATTTTTATTTTAATVPTNAATSTFTTPGPTGNTAVNTSCTSPTSTATTHGTTATATATTAATATVSAWEVLQGLDILPVRQLPLPSDDITLWTVLANFSSPAVDWATCARVLRLEERRRDLASTTMTTMVVGTGGQTDIETEHDVAELPDQPMIVMDRRSLVVAILRHNHALTQLLPEPFVCALLRLVCRLLSQESDLIYQQQCGLVPPPVLPNVLDNMIDTIPQPRDLPHLPYSMVRFMCNWLGNSSSSSRSLDRPQDSQQQQQQHRNETHNDHSTPTPRLLAVHTLLYHHDRAASPELKDRLFHLLALTTAAGVAPGLLRKRILLQCPAHPKPRLSHNFCFGHGAYLRRTLSGLPQWPFRSDFGLATWFRAERFTGEMIIRLFRVEETSSSHHPFTVEIRLEPVPHHEACTVAVQVGDGVMNGGFLVLPRVWYHLAVRHTRARLKGVFSLTTREQLSIFLDGKPMLTEAFPFPKMDHDDRFGTSTGTSTVNMTVSLGENFEGQTGALYLFDDNVSDTSLRALYEITGGQNKGTTTKPSSTPDTTWDAHRGDLVRKSRVLDASIAKDDADEIVLSQRRPSGARKRMLSSKFAAVVDLLDDDEAEEPDIPAELQRSAFASKILLVWDPRRTVGGLSLELHLGAHVDMNGVYAWCFNGVQDVIGSIGGIQALIPAFRSILVSDATLDDKEKARQLYRRSMILPSLFSLLSSYVREHSDNARELLRCGGIDVIEQMLLSSRKACSIKPNDTSLFGLLNSSMTLSKLLGLSLLELRGACAHYVGLETKVYSRLLFNFPLWIGNLYQDPNANTSGSAMALVFLPILAALTKQNPEKARDCIGVAEMVQALKNCLSLSCNGSKNRFEEAMPEKMDCDSQALTDTERTYIGNMLLGMIFYVLSAGTNLRDVSAFVHYLAHCLDDLTESRPEIGPNVLTTSAAKVLLLLLQIRPVVPNFCESFAETCGGLQGAASWILTSMINSVYDEIRSIGVRCLGAYLDHTSRGVDTVLAIPLTIQSSKSATDVGRSSNRLSSLAKGIATIGPSTRIPLQPSKLTTRVIFKLLWHLLKSRRSSLGDMTHRSLLAWITDDDIGVSKSLESRDYVAEHLTHHVFGVEVPFFDIVWTRWSLTDLGNLAGKTMRNAAAVGTVLRLLRFLDDPQKDMWLDNFLLLTKSNRKNIGFLCSLPEWQNSIFAMVSETLEQASARKRKGFDAGIDEPLQELCKRLDHCITFYSRLLGHMIRVGGDQSLESVEKTTALERVFVNGRDVLLLLFSGVCIDMYHEGTLVDVGTLSAQDWKDVDIERDSLLLKQSAKLVTDAILSQGTKGLDMPSAVRSWRGLRHLTEVAVAITSLCGFGAVDLFSINNNDIVKCEPVTGGLNGIRLADDAPIEVVASDYVGFLPIDATYNSDNQWFSVEAHLCCRVVVQVFSLLDAFIFPQASATSQKIFPVDGLALVRFSEARLGDSQGPLVSSAIRLSFILLVFLEPGSLALLECVGRLRCLLSWSLDLLSESHGVDGQLHSSHRDGSSHFDRLILCTVLHCHRVLQRCSIVWLAIEENETSFATNDAQKKYLRRIGRVVIELKDLVEAMFRERTDLFITTLTKESFECLRQSLKEHEIARSKDSAARGFLDSPWVQGFKDEPTEEVDSFPQQAALARGIVRWRSKGRQAPHSQGVVALEKLTNESAAIVADFNNVIDGCFKIYLEEQRKWAETDAVRDLEYDGDTTAKRMAERHHNDTLEGSKISTARRSGADTRWKGIYRKTVGPWKDENHWKLSRQTDLLGRRTLLVQNTHFTDHGAARHDSSSTNTAPKTKTDLKEVMRRNAEAFVSNARMDERDEESSLNLISDGESSTDLETSTDADSVDRMDDFVQSVPEDEEWDKIDNQEIEGIDADGGSDSWAKTFIWAQNEILIACFEPVMIVSLQSYVEGKLLLTSHGLYFRQIGEETNTITRKAVDAAEATIMEGKDRRWRLARLTEVHGRRYMLRPQALELFFADGHELLLNFPTGSRDRDRFYAKLRNSCRVPMLWSPKSLSPRAVFRKSKITELWRKRRISNFEYIMALNRMAGRSFNDLTQYPVFPWVLADYSSKSIDLSDSRVYRDLSKPIGALNPNRLAQLLERYKDLELFGFSESEKFLYGSHYSSPGIVLHYLIRQEPFTSMAIDLQSGRFDCPDRLFFDVAESWNSCLTSSSDMKELIPEFFSLPEMFLNTNKFPLGKTQNGRMVDDVGLPPWAKSSAHEFVRIQKLALEEEYVSQNLHHWIDLIFGFKQRGPEAESAHNLFHHLSYEGSVDLEKIADEVDRQAAESHIQNFGQTPSQLKADGPHPPRLPPEQCWSPLISNAITSRGLRCHTPSKQFANKKSELAKGAILKLQVLSDVVIAIYSDMSLGTYRWSPSSKSNRLRMDKLRPIPRRHFSTSRAAIKRGSLVSVDRSRKGELAIGNWCFAVTLGGQVKEELRRSNIVSSGRIISSTDASLAAAEAGAMVLSCSYWDGTIKAHSLDSLKVVSSEPGGHIGAIKCIALGDDGALMVSGGQDCTVRAWVVDHPDMSIALSDGYVQTALGASYDGEQLITCCHVLWGHDSPVTCVDLDTNLDAVVSGSEAGLVCVHTLRRGEFIRSFYPPAMTSARAAGSVDKIAVGSEGHFAVHMEDLGLHFYSINCIPLGVADAGEIIHDMKICSNDQVLVTGGTRCQALVRKLPDLQVCAMLDLSRHGPIQSIAFTPSDLNPVEQFLFIGSDDGMITIVDKDPLIFQAEESPASF